VNKKPQIDKRIPKAVAVAGKPFSIVVDKDVFSDEEDKTNLELFLLDKNSQPIPSNSWIRFDKEKREIYGLPLESDVSRYEFKLRAADSGGEHVEENIDITVQQHKGFRSVNHEIYILVKLEKNYESAVDWEIRLLQGIVEAVGDQSLASMVVREVRPHKYEANMYTFVFTNETLPKDKCPKAELDALMQRMTKQALNKEMSREITVRNVEKDLIGPCKEQTPTKHVISTNTKNFPPTVRNPVDRVVAHVGQLLVFEVPKDTFYDPEDQTDLKLSLVNEDRSDLSPENWLQFDSKNREFYGVPMHDTKKQQNYVLVAKDKNQLSTNDALVVEVDHSNYNRELSASFKFQLDIAVREFQNAAVKRKFIETIQKIFGDLTTENIIIKVSSKVQYAGRTAVVVQNTTLNHSNFPKCPNEEIEKLRRVLLRHDNSIKDEIKEEFKADFPVTHISVTPSGEFDCKEQSFEWKENCFLLSRKMLSRDFY
jgi:dystroglycan 1